MRDTYEPAFLVCKRPIHTHRPARLAASPPPESALLTDTSDPTGVVSAVPTFQKEVHSFLEGYLVQWEYRQWVKFSKYYMVATIRDTRRWMQSRMTLEIKYDFVCPVICERVTSKYSGALDTLDMIGPGRSVSLFRRPCYLWSALSRQLWAVSVCERLTVIMNLERFSVLL
ncbi:hypothetical protein EVAR_23730_1 [Eumeta japonica]|uniref:Uncharacterized protein n=1 Tax=Eumeta variegata TaxID=151549 RepID=A0A4C1VGT9_EUMVA|nr:hypothetical protein EVAR_23730_1 [Eumeta japonica]